MQTPETSDHAVDARRTAPTGTTAEALPGIVESALAAAEHPLVLGISGHAGAGKSTLARDLVEQVGGAVRMRGDDFLDPARSHHRSPDWAGVERVRLRDTVLRPFRERRTASFRRFDWGRRALGEPEPVPTGRLLVVDLIGLFHPEVLAELDLRVWCELDPATAAERGMARDHALGRDHDRLWREVWVPNERDFAERFAPREAATHVVATG